MGGLINTAIKKMARKSVCTRKKTCRSVSSIIRLFHSQYTFMQLLLIDGFALSLRLNFSLINFNNLRKYCMQLYVICIFIPLYHPSRLYQYLRHVFST